MNEQIPTNEVVDKTEEGIVAERNVKTKEDYANWKEEEKESEEKALEYLKQIVSPEDFQSLYMNCPLHIGEIGETEESIKIETFPGCNVAELLKVAYVITDKSDKEVIIDVRGKEIVVRSKQENEDEEK